MREGSAESAAAGAGSGSGGEIREDREPSFGEYLLRERERRKLPLREAAAAIRIPVSHLEALEDDAYGELPPQTYVRGFLEAYARFLGLDPSDVHRRYEKAIHADALERRDEGRASIFGLFQPRGEGFHWRDWAIPLLLAIVVVLFGVSRIFVGAPGGGPESAPQPAPAPTPAPETAPPPALPPAEFQAAREPDAPPDMTVGVRLVAVAVASTWMAAELDGGRVEEWTLRSGESRELAAKRKIVLSIGNAGAVRLTHNGRELGFIGHKGQVKRNLVFLAVSD